MDFSCGWTGGRAGGRAGIEGTLRGPRGPKNRQLLEFGLLVLLHDITLLVELLLPPSQLLVSPTVVLR